MTTQPFSCHHGRLCTHLPGTQRQLLGGGITLQETWHCSMGPAVRGSGRRRLRPYRSTSMSCAEILAAMLFLLARVLLSRHVSWILAPPQLRCRQCTDGISKPVHRSDNLCEEHWWPYVCSTPWGCPVHRPNPIGQRALPAPLPPGLTAVASSSTGPTAAAALPAPLPANSAAVASSSTGPTAAASSGQTTTAPTGPPWQVQRWSDIRKLTRMQASTKQQIERPYTCIP